MLALRVMTLTLITIYYDSTFRGTCATATPPWNASTHRLEYVISHDPLTALPNGLGVIAGAEPLIAAARQGGAHVAVIVLNVDRLKPINDSLGQKRATSCWSVVAASACDAEARRYCRQTGRG